MEIYKYKKGRWLIDPDPQNMSVDVIPMIDNEEFHSLEHAKQFMSDFLDFDSEKAIVDSF